MAFYGKQGQLAAVSSCGMYTLSAKFVALMQQPMTMQEGLALLEESHS